MNGRARCGFVGCCLLLFSCGAPRSELQVGGTSVAPGPCGRGLVVVESDFQSSNVSLLDFQGTLLAPSVASSSSQAGGFGVALSGDVTPPGSPSQGPQLVLLDRYPAGVLRFVDVQSGAVTSELPVATGFRANPHDYLALGAHQAYVSRYDQNPSPGAQAWDAGADLLIVDPSVPAITGSVDLSSALAHEAPSFSAHPGRLVAVGTRVFALLSAYANDYRSSLASRLVEVDSERDVVVSTLLLADLHGCDALALSPSAGQLAVGCTGGDLGGSPPSLVASGIALVDIAAEPRLAASFPAATFGTNAIGFALDYAAPEQLLFSTLGDFGDTGRALKLDTLVTLDTRSGAFSVVTEAATQPFTLGDVRCAPACGVCFLADAERRGGSVLRFPIDGQGRLGEFSALRVETRVGLPPRYLGAF